MEFFAHTHPDFPDNYEHSERDPLTAVAGSEGWAFWAKTTEDGKPGISVLHHCLNVGCVAEALAAALPDFARRLLPAGASTLAALHDVGKITLGFQAKSPVWLVSAKLDAEALLQAAYSVSDHALVSQVFLQGLLGPGSRLWAAAVGAHHGRPKGRNANLTSPEAMAAWADKHRQLVARDLIAMLGSLPSEAPNPRFRQTHSDLWLMAGLITVADWIGSNEIFFSPEHGYPLNESRRLSKAALASIGWPGGSLKTTSFNEAFGFDANVIQETVIDAALNPGLIIVEAPMGSGKTEAALKAAQQLIAAGHHHGIYFALPTQVTSNRIHQRIGDFLRKTLDDPAHLRLAHANAWLEDNYTLLLHPTFAGWKETDGEKPSDYIREARSWFASGKQAMLAPYGVGTIDQALQAVVVVKHFFVRRFALAGKVVILDEIHSYDVYTGTLVAALVRELMNLGCSVIILSATLTAARRRELLEAAQCVETDSPADYPLITVGTSETATKHLSPTWRHSKYIVVRADTIAEGEVISTLISRAESGQHVLWIRNTVVEAQESFRVVRAEVREGDVRLGLLHSRFPFERRAEIEDEWLERLGKNRQSCGYGSILIATQVVEQSVDIDLDFIVSDLAPTDMLLQRMGRLWRHERADRVAGQAEFWIRVPELDLEADARVLKKSLGRSARVYAPYVLLRSACVFAQLTSLNLPRDIRRLLEDTYADPSSNEPMSWDELHKELEAEKKQLMANAEAAMRVFGLPMVDSEDDHALTRRKGPPTVPVLLLRSAERTSASTWRLAALNGTGEAISEVEWRKNSASFLHRWIVRIPRWMVPMDAIRPRWLGLHGPFDAVLAIVEPDGHLLFNESETTTSYHDDFGVFAERPAQKVFQFNDDEFDS